MRNIKLSDSQDRAIQQGESAIGMLFAATFALLVIIWLCHDTSAGLTQSLHHISHQRSASTLSIIMEWFE